MRSPIWHALENATFVGSGLLFWWPVILPWPGKARWPRWSIPLDLLGSDMPVPVLSAYLASALDDQVAAAMLAGRSHVVGRPHEAAFGLARCSTHTPQAGLARKATTVAPHASALSTQLRRIGRYATARDVWSIEVDHRGGPGLRAGRARLRRQWFKAVRHGRRGR